MNSNVKMKRWRKISYQRVINQMKKRSNSRRHLTTRRTLNTIMKGMKKMKREQWMRNQSTRGLEEPTLFQILLTLFRRSMRKKVNKKKGSVIRFLKLRKKKAPKMFLPKCPYSD